MEKKRAFRILFLLVILVMIFAYILKPIKILIDKEKVEVINIYDIGSEKSVDINQREKIDKYVDEINGLKLKKKKVVSNSSADGIIIIAKDSDGNVMDTLYLSEKEIIYNHWLVVTEDGSNPYEKFIMELNQWV